MSDISTQKLIELALDLATSLSSKDRFERLLNTVRHVIPCDAVVLLCLQHNQLKPLAQQGLIHEVLGRRFDIDAHPRLHQICLSSTPVRFPADSPLPDPYDGLLLARDGQLPIHACMGLPLMIDNQLLGLLTLDSMTEGAFDDIPQKSLDILTAMAAANLKTALLLEQLEISSQHSAEILADLTQEALIKDGGEIIGESDAMNKLQREIHTVANSDFSVLIEGETGVGKELVARTLHQLSPRKNQALVYVNCAALPENLIESELFGHIKGSFTGASQTRLGKFNLADGGTIFLDEIGELPLVAQSKLLRTLQNKEVQAVGSDTIKHVDVRVIAATNRQLKQEVKKGLFRSDLYHRLNAYPIYVPALRERGSDIILLAGFFLEKARRQFGIKQLKFSKPAINLLMQYQWPGNVRELEHIINRAALQASITRKLHQTVTQINIDHLSIDLETRSTHSNPESNDDQASTPPSNTHTHNTNLKQATEDFQRNLIHTTLTKTQGNFAKAARLLETDRANLNRLAKRLGIHIKKTVVQKPIDE